MSRAFPFLLIALSASLGGRGLHAQTAPADPTVVATVQRLFDAMAAHDTAAARSLLVPGTRFVSISNGHRRTGCAPSPLGPPADTPLPQRDASRTVSNSMSDDRCHSISSGVTGRSIRSKASQSSFENGKKTKSSTSTSAGRP
jgi:hypothetical protein